MKTKAELIDAVLENLRVKPATQSASAEDTAVVDSRIQPTIDLLDGKNVQIAGDLSNLDQIPDALFLPLAACVAYQCATPFMISGTFKQELKADQDQAIRDMQMINRQGFDAQKLRVRRFWRRWPIGSGYDWAKDQ